MARSDPPTSDVQMRSDRRRTHENTKILDIALLPTLARRENIEEITANYGFVIVDECHHVAASAFFHVLSRIPARYWLGLTATPERRDGLEDLIYHQLGSHHVTLERPGVASYRPTAQMSYLLTLYFTCIPPDSGTAVTRIPALRVAWRRSIVRSSPTEIASTRSCQDVLTAADEGANIRVLTTWVDHLNAIAERLRGAGKVVITLSGKMKAGDRRHVTDQLAGHTSDAEPLLIVGTSSFIGEGFDCPALHTLFLAAPITFKNRLVQYIGRITRPCPGKTTATVHDYHDELTPVIASALKKHTPGYLKMGFPDPRAQMR